MKTGTQIYCIKDYTNHPTIHLHKNKYYKIYEIIDFFDNSRHKQIKSVNVNNMIFTLKKDNEPTYHPRFFNHFITIKEFRIIKLKKILKISKNRHT